MRRLALATLCAVLAGCAGSRTSTALPPISKATAAPAQDSTATVRFSIAIPQRTATQESRRPQYVSPSTEWGNVTDTSASGTLQSNITCTTTTCTGQIAAPIGKNTFSIALSDQFGRLLSSGSATATIVPDQVNNVSVTFNPVVASVSLPNLSATAGSAQSIAVAVTALDADNNVIQGPGIYLDSQGTPFTMTVKDLDPKANTSLVGSTTITGPGGALSLKYNGAAHTTAILTITATSTNVPVSGGSFASLSNAGKFPFIVFPGPANMTIGPDGAMWAVASLTNGYDLVRVAADGTQTAHFVPFPPPANSWQTVSVSGIVSGPNGEFWLTVNNGLQTALQHVTTAGVAQTITDPSFKQLAGITVSPDGNLWVVDMKNNSLDRVTPAGVVTVYPTPELGPTNLAFSASGDIYFGGNSEGLIESFDPTTAAFTQHLLPSGPTLMPNDAYVVAPGPAGNVWFTPYDFGEIGYVTPAGTVALFPWSSLTGGLAEGADGNMWFVDVSRGLAWITPDGHVGLYPIPGIGEVFDFAIAPDGSFWVPTQEIGGNIGDLVHLAF